MAYRLEVTLAARQDLAEYADFIRIDRASPEAARRWLKGIQAGIRALKNNPSQFSVISEAQTLGPFRSFNHKSHRVIFWIDADLRVVTVVRIYHGSRRPLREGDLQ